MVLCEDGECSVCLSAYSRMDRVPRLLHCRHTFCEPCLETMSQSGGGLLTVGCPLCRRVTCIGRGLSLQEALWVDSRLWDQIQEDVEAEEEEDGLKRAAEEEEEEAEEEEEGTKQQASEQAERSSSRPARTKLKLPAFFRRFSLTRQQQERIVPSTNVEMKSWRRLPAEEAL